VPGGGGSWFGFGGSGAVSGAVSSAVSGVGVGGGSSSSSSPGAVPGGKQRPADEAQPMTDEQEEVD
jgi:hypothetical protein